MSNLSETLLEGSKDHLLNRARTDLSVSASMIHKNERRYKIGHYKMYNTNLLNLIENKLDFKRNCCEKRMLFEIRRLQVCADWRR